MAESYISILKRVSSRSGTFSLIIVQPIWVEKRFSLNFYHGMMTDLSHVTCFWEEKDVLGLGICKIICPLLHQYVLIQIQER